MDLHQRLRTLFPKLETFEITSDPSAEYNCIAWAAGEIDRWWWPHPDAHWPADAPLEESLAAFMAAFASLGYEASDSQDLEPGFDKIAIYAIGNRPTHAARQLTTGKWTSKLGELHDIAHDLEGVEGTTYGRPVLFMKRAYR